METWRIVLEALEDLLDELGATNSEERRERLRRDLAALLDALECARSQSEWEQLEEQLDALRERYGIAGGASPSLDGDLHGHEVWKSPMKGGAHGEPRRWVEPPAHAANNLAARLRRLIGVEATVPITTYPSIEAPEEVVERTAFRVEVTARARPTDGTAEPVVVPRDRPDPIDLEVEVGLPADGSITARSQLTQPLRVPEQGDSATLGFRLFAERRGKSTIVVRLRDRRVERAVVRREVGVISAAEAETSPPAAGVGRTLVALWGMGEVFAGLRLTVEERGRDRDDRYLRVRLEGPGALLAAPIEGIQSVPSVTSALLPRLCHDMDTARALGRDDGRELRLENIGAELSGALLPEPIRRALAGAPARTALHVEAEDAWVPWEMLRVAGAGFLGEHFALTRWLRSGSLRDRLPGGRALLVAPSGSGLDVNAERASLEVLTGAPPQELGQAADVQARLATADSIGFLHFACHGRTPPGEPLGGILRLEGGSLRYADVRDPFLHGGAAPLAGTCVFINACEAAIAEHALSGHGGWAEVLLRAQAGAVIAPLWSVHDKLASAFAAGFYELLRAGETLGEAARRTRIAVRRQGDPDRLAYTVYASPTARLASPAPSRPHIR